jgi:hypothetical protein
MGVDFVEIALEETANNELQYASALTPYRKSTNLSYLPSQSVKIAPGVNPMSRADELRGIPGEVARLKDDFQPTGKLSVRAYGDILPFLLALSGFSGVVTPGGSTITDPNTTTVSGANSLNSATINVVDATPFESTGSVVINGINVTYTGKTATSLTGCGSHAAYTGGESVFGNVPTGAYKWVFTKQAGIGAQTARFRTNYIDENVELDGYGFAISQLAIAADASLDADLTGLFMRRLAADTSTVPVIQAGAIQPFRHGDLYISALSGGGVVGDWTCSIANSLERIKTMSLTTPSDWPDVMEFGDDQVQVAGTLPKRVLSGVDYDALLAATTFAMTAKWAGRSNIAATAKKYGLWIQMPACQYVGGDQDDLQNKRRHGFSPDWFAAIDDTLGYDCKITVVCGVPAIATYV